MNERERKMEGGNPGQVLGYANRCLNQRSGWVEKMSAS